MADSWNKFVLLLWKNWVLQKRKKIQTAVEIAAPVFCTALLVLFRTLVSPETYDDVLFTPFDPLGNSAPGQVNVEDFWNDAQKYNLTTIVYSPCGNAHVEKIMSMVKHPSMQVAPCLRNGKQLEGMMTLDFHIFAGVQFDDSYATNGNKLPKNIDYEIRFPGELRTVGAGREVGLDKWRTYLLFPLFQFAGPRDRYSNEGADPAYKRQGFLALQKVVSSAIINVVQGIETGNVDDLPQVMLQRFPYPGWVEDPLLTALEGFVSLIIMLSFFYTCIKTVQVITTEKEKQLKESMKIMGLPSWLHWTAWFTKTFIFLMITVILMVIILKVTWVHDPDLAVFTHSNGGVLFIFLLIYMCTTTTFCFAISVFFSKANTAATVAGLLWFVSYVPYSFMQQEYLETSLTKKLASSLASNTAMAYGFQLFVMWESTEEGVQFDNIWRSVSPDDDLVLGHIMMMLIVDAIIYLLIALYVEAVMPGEYGVPKPWYFPVTKTFWCGDDDLKRRLGSPGEVKDFNQDKTIFETEPEGLNAGVQIQNLRKVYSNNKVAVRDMNLNMYEGQITALLGHNGAGKTTTMSILTGMFPPSGGTAFVAGYDVRTQSEGARSSLGLCPQHNVLFDEMTVAEHLYFFGRLKGLDSKVINREIDKYVDLLELKPKRDVKSSALSGGMKRKLSVGVALCGNSKVVMLDEPTAGMDPAARRAIWDILQEQKQGRTILLTTHFMDEADLLGDRIAIMAGGQLQCCGSSFFLKKRYGAGYHLIMEKTSKCNVANVTELLRQYIPDIKVDHNVGSELSYVLAENYSTIFEEMLSKLENNSENLGIASYGVSLATLEEVFMKVGADVGQEEVNNALENSKKNNYVQNGDTNSNSSATRLDVENISLLTGIKLLQNQTVAMVMKKALSLWRSWYLYLIQILIAVLFMVLTVIIVRSMPTGTDQPALEITLDSYNDPITVLGTTDETNPFYTKSVEYLKEIKHQIQNLKTDNISEYMLKLTADTPSISRNRYIVGATIEEERIIAWFNNNPYHSPPLALSFAMNVVLKKFSNDYEITVSNHPIPYDLSAKIRELQTGNGMDFQVSFNLAFSMSIISAFYILFYVRERVIKAKHLQFVSGVKVFTFWGVAFLWDLLTYLVIAVSIVLTLLAFQEDGFKTAGDLGRLFTMLFVFGMAMLPMNYLFSFLFDTPSTGFTRMVLLNVFTGTATLLLTAVLSIPALDLHSTERAIHWTFLFVPLYSMGSGIRDMSAMFKVYDVCEKFAIMCVENGGGTLEQCWRLLWNEMGQTQCKEPSTDYFSLYEERAAGRNVLISMCVTFALIGVLMLYEYGFLNWCRMGLLRRNRTKPANSESPAENDQDVLNEQNTVRQLTTAEIKRHPIVLQNITKYYKNFLAVDNLSLAVSRFECFGLLGVNGAGKTTTFKMMTGDVMMSSGKGWAGGYNLKTQIKQVHKLIGYCPQFDAVLDDLTGRETLVMFGLLRGIPQGETNFVAEKLSKDLDFNRHLDKKVKEYSGGNKRKLSTAVALIGDPPIVFLDEPTTGMDPATKRHLWDALCKVRDAGKCLVLTSHSMEECEALCTRLAIMVNGRFMCLGSTQHLKNKFSEGYTLTIKIKKSEQMSEAARSLEHFVKSSFPSAVLREHYQELMTFYIVDRSLPWSKMFGIMERAKKEMNIEDYSLGQASLEQVFLSFTKLQRSENASS